MAGIYIHIPFCKQACNYCDFHFSTSLKNKDAFITALKAEIALQKDYLGYNEIVNTIYFGGGTPSLLSSEELLTIFDALYTHFTIAADAEITLEANPDDLSNQKIAALKTTPVNRFSVGIQSFLNADLQFMNRAHTADEAVRSVKALQDNGFTNISIDLIYGTPTLTHANWIANLEMAFSMEVNHVSSYCLTVEPKTALANQIKTGKAPAINDQHSAEQFMLLMEQMQQHNFIHYEISNFCKAGYSSKHNSNYWKKVHYLGLGPSAHSFNGVSRQWNISNNALYLRALQNNTLNFEQEFLTLQQQYNEYILTALRTNEGVDLAQLEQLFGEQQQQHCLAEAAFHLKKGNVLLENNHLYLTQQGKLLADRIASDLFSVEPA